MLDPAYHAERLSARLRAAAPAKTAGGGGLDDDSVATTVRGMTPWERANSNESPASRRRGQGRRRGRRGVQGLARGRISRRRRRRRTPSGSSLPNARAEKVQKGGQESKVEEDRRTGGGDGRFRKSRSDAAPGDGRGQNHRGKRDARARGEGSGERRPGEVAGGRADGILGGIYGAPFARGGWGGRDGNRRVRRRCRPRGFLLRRQTPRASAPSRRALRGTECPTHSRRDAIFFVADD